MSPLIKIWLLLLDHYFQLLLVSLQGSVVQLPHVFEPKDESLGRWRLCGSWAMAEKAGWLYLTVPWDNRSHRWLRKQFYFFQLQGKRLFSAEWRTVLRESRKLTNLHPTKPVGALKTGLLLLFFNIPEAAGAGPASVSPTAFSDKKKISKHKSMLLFSALFSQLCLWSLHISPPWGTAETQTAPVLYHSTGWTLQSYLQNITLEEDEV